MSIFTNFMHSIVNLDTAFLRQKGSGFQVAVTVEQDGTGTLGVVPAITEYVSPMDFTATYTSPSTITLTGLPFTIASAQQIEYIKITNTVTNATANYMSGTGGYSFSYSSGVITVYLNGVVVSLFTANDVYEVGVVGPKKAYDPTLDINKTIDQSPLSAKYVPDTLNSTPNLPIGTAYFPSATGMSMDGYKHMSLAGQLIDSGTVTLSVEVSNDPAFANPVKIYGYDSQNNVMANQIATTSSVFSIDFDFLNYTYFRVKVVTGTATNTVTILARRIY